MRLGILCANCAQTVIVSLHVFFMYCLYIWCVEQLSLPASELNVPGITPLYIIIANIVQVGQYVSSILYVSGYFTYFLSFQQSPEGDR